MSMFAVLGLFHDIIPHTAAMNMAIDEALLQCARLPSIRFYRWDHPALSFGYFGKFAEVETHTGRRDVVRRWTGGGIVFHGDDLTYSIVIPSSDPVFRESSMSIYEKVHCALCGALAANGEHAELASPATADNGGEFRGAHAPSRAPIGALADRSLRPKEDFGEASKVQAGLAYSHGGESAPQMCFANPVRADVLLNGQKIAGAAQRRTHRGLLQQGSIQNFDFGNGLAERFARALSRRIETQVIDHALIERGKKIAQEKYGSEAWLRKR